MPICPTGTCCGTTCCSEVCCSGNPFGYWCCPTDYLCDPGSGGCICNLPTQDCYGISFNPCTHFCCDTHICPIGSVCGAGVGQCDYL